MTLTSDQTRLLRDKGAKESLRAQEILERPKSHNPGNYRYSPEIPVNPLDLGGLEFPWLQAVAHLLRREIVRKRDSIPFGGCCIVRLLRR
eukprot:181967-Amorphochlora_amoeboformis.AAC.2